jgi:hypothetical protein
MKFSYYSGRIDEHMGGGEGRRGAPHVPPIKIFEKLPHKNAIKHDPPMIFSQPQVPPQKNLPKKPRTPLDFQLLCIYERKLLNVITDFAI